MATDRGSHDGLWTPAVRRGLRRGAWGLLTLLCLGVAGRTAPLIAFDPSVFPEPFRSSYAPILTVVMVHGACGIVALAALPLLAHPGLLRRCPAAHRVLGRGVLLAVLAGGATGLLMAARAQGGVAARLGFAGMAVAWLMTATLGFRAIRRRQVQRHRRWMVRNIALTFAAVTLRLQLTAATLAGLALPVVYPWIAWLAWLPNLIVAEMILRRRR